MSTDSHSASSHEGSKPPGMWQPPLLEEMQAMLPQYQFISLLGRGGMGAVYKALQVSLERPVAIKVLPGDLIDDADSQFAERFKNEARTMAKMNHPAIVNVYDFGETQTGLLFIVMEFIDGTDVSKMIVSQGRLPPDYALAITAHVCDALNYAHSHSIVHRDIKPANILINMDGAVKVADFGLAKQSDAGTGGLTRTNMAMGTPDFVAPEALIPGMLVDGRADLYAIGVMLYQMLTGEIPRGMWTMPGLKLGTDPRFDAIIAKAMQTDREMRYQTAAAIRRDLDVIMTTPPAAVKRPAAQAPPPRGADAPIRNQAAEKPADHVLASASTKKSSTSFHLGMAAAVVGLAVGAFFVFGGLGKPMPAPAPVAAAPQESKPASPAPEPAVPKTSPPVPQPTAAAAPAPAFSEAVPALSARALDLLPGIDLGLDTVGGKWVRNDDGVTYDRRSGDRNARVQIPVSTTGSFTLDVELSTSAAPGDVVLFLPLSKQDDDDLQNIAFNVHHDNKGAHKAGFVHFQGHPGFTRNTPGWVALEKPLEGRSRITIQVLELQPDRLALKAWLNGMPLVAWEGPRGETTGGSRFWRPADQGWFAVGTTEEGTVFHRVRLEAVGGEVSWIRNPAGLTAASVPAPAVSNPPAMTTTAPTPTPADPVSERLASLEKIFQEAYEKQAGAAHTAALADLNTKFTAALDRGIAAVSQAGNLDEALALRNEKSLIQTSGTVPEEDAEGTPETLQALRKTYRATMAALLATRDKNAAPLHAAYDRALGAYQEELTKAQKLDEALRVKAVREHVAAQRDQGAGASSPQPGNAGAGARMAPLLGQGTGAVPIAPPLPADKVLPPLPKAAPEEIRALCEWALAQPPGQRARLRLAEGNGSRYVDQPGDLPKGTLKLLEFDIYSLPMDAAGLKWFAILGRCPDLERIAFSTNPGTMPIEMLRGATKLKSLHIKPTEIDDVAFAHLSGLKSLETLAVDYRVKNFTGEGLGYLHDGLLELSIDSPALTEKGLSYLPRFKKLQRLAFNNSSASGRCLVTDAMLKVLASLPELEELDLSSTPVDGSFLTHLPANSKLKRLYLQSIKTFKPENLKNLAMLKDLEVLSLPPVDVAPEAAAALAGLGNLRALTLNFNDLFTGESLQKVKGFRSLRDLDVNVCPITDKGLDAIANAMPELYSFRMSREDRSKAIITPEGFSQTFGRLRNLASLQFNGGRITDAWLPHIAQLKAVDYLMLTGAQITDQGLAPLMRLPLGYLRLDGTPVTDAVIPILKTCPTLTNVPVGGTKMTDAGKAELQRMLEGNKGR